MLCERTTSMKKITSISLLFLLAFSFYSPVQALGYLSLSQTSITLNTGSSMTITANPPSGQTINLTSLTNSLTAYATVSGNQITVYGLSNGSTDMTFCTYDNTCATVFVTVTGSGNTNNSLITFSQNSVSLNQYQNTSVNIYNNNSYNGYYISNNSNSNAVTASISSSVLNLYGQNIGSSTITICMQNSSQCGTVYVSVSGNNQGNPYFTTTSLPQPRVNQYYSYQFGIAGGSAPYNFQLSSGSLPLGLTLSPSGLLYGYPANTQGTNFTIRAIDQIGRNAFSPSLTLNPTYGAIAGALVYNNGTLINDNGTIYITYKNTKSGFASLFAFTSHGFKLNNVINASTTGLTNSGFVIIATTDNTHPWGSWIKQNNTIYFVHESGLIPIPSMDVFTNNGGVLANVVDASGYDFNRTMQYPMQLNDSRLR